MRGRRAWGCDRWRDGCHLVVPFEVDGVLIPPDEADRLFRRGQTRLFADHPGTGQRARLVLAPDEERPVRWEETKRKRRV